jgi:hypothetical protein
MSNKLRRLFRDYLIYVGVSLVAGSAVIWVVYWISSP